MFSRKRSRSTKMGDLAQFRKEVEAIVDQIGKDFEKNVENFKSNENVKQFIAKLQDSAHKLKQDITKKFDGTVNVDVVAVRKEFDQWVAKIVTDFKKDAAAFGDNAQEMQGKLADYFQNSGRKIAEKFQDYHVRDEAVKIRIDIERKLSEMANSLEKDYENVRDMPAVKEMVKNLRKINESIAKEIGKRMDDFKNDKIDVQQNVETMLKKISTDFEKTLKNANDQEKAVVEKVRSKTNEIASEIGERFENLRKNINDLKISDELQNIRNIADKSLSTMTADFKDTVRKLDKGDVHLIDNLTKTFAEAAEKLKEEIHSALEGFREDSSKAKEKVEELLGKFSQEFQKRVDDVKGMEVMKEVQNTVEEASKKASSEISHLADGLKKKVDEFENQDKVVKARKEMERIFGEVQKTIDTDFQALKDNQYVKEAAVKLNEINQQVQENINILVSSAKAKQADFETEMKKIFDKMHKDYEEAMVQIKDNPNVQELLKKAKSISHALSEDVGKVLDTIRENKTVETILDNAKVAAETVKEDIAEITDKAESSATSMYNGFREKASGIFSGTTRGPKKMPVGLGRRNLESNSESSAVVKAVESIQKTYYATFCFVVFLIKSIPALISHVIGLFMPKSLDNKVVVITGTGSGLGKALARKCLRLGAKVACVDVNESANSATGEELLKKAKCHTCVRTYSCDISKPDNCKKLAKDILDNYGRVDILINNAGILGSHEINGGDDAAIQRVIDVNLMSNFWMVRAFLPYMKSKKEGQIVFINSEAGIHGLAKASSYAASKAGLLGLAYSLESELRQDSSMKNIKITSVHPPFFAKSTAYQDKDCAVMTTDAVAEWTLHGIRRNLFTFAVPLVYGGFALSTLTRLLPPRFYNFFVVAMGIEERTAAMHTKID